MNFQMFKLVLEKSGKQEIQLPISIGSTKKQESFSKTSISALLTMPKPLTMDHNKLWTILQEMGIPDHLTCPLRNLYADQQAIVRTGHGTKDWFQSRKEYVKAAYCHPAYLTYMQTTSGEIPGWMKHKVESRLLGEMSITSDMQMTPPSWQKVKKTKESLDKSERGE